VWWVCVRGLMTVWVDRVFAICLLYGLLGCFNHGGLKGRRAMVSTTTGCYPEMVESGGIMGHLDAMLWHLQYGTLAYVGFDVLEPFVTWSARYTDRLQREQRLEEYAHRLRHLDTIPTKFIHPVEDFGKDWRLKPGIVPRTLAHQPFPP
ncbi:MAG: NAD(P)H-dependent oxidoreductase, partial [Panacagrimonas sp.]